MGCVVIAAFFARVVCCLAVWPAMVVMDMLAVTVVMLDERVEVIAA